MRRFVAALDWLDDRTGLVKGVRKVARHRVPRAVSTLKRGWFYLFGFGTVTAFLVQAVTGVALTTMYIPSTGSAYESLQYITEVATLGNLVRGMHYFGASAMVVLITAHLFRVFLTGSYKFPREVNWLGGVVLLGLTIGLAFTGMLLRWDQDSIGSVLIATEQAGRAPIIGDLLGRAILAGDTISGTTLSRFYALHVFVLPGALIAFLTLHMFLVIRNGISEPPDAKTEVDPGTYRREYRESIRRDGVAYFPFAMWREIVFGTGVVVVIVVLALLVGPRALSEAPDPTLTSAEPKPDWYFLWYQAYLEVLPEPVSAYAIVLTPLVAAIVLLSLPFVANKGHRSPLKRPWAVGVSFLAGLTLVLFFVVGLAAPYVPRFDTQPLDVEAIGLSGEAREGYRIFFEQGCQYCHGVKGEGGEYGPDLTHVMQRISAEQVTITILRGREDMPAYRNSITERELQQILAFLEEVDSE